MVLCDGVAFLWWQIPTPGSKRELLLTTPLSVHDDHLCFVACRGVS